MDTSSALEQKELFSYNDIRKASLVLRALNHPLRQKIVGFLAKNSDATVTILIDYLQLEQSVVSQHLAILRRARIVHNLKKSKFVHYYINDERIEEIQSVISALLNAPAKGGGD